MTPPIVANKKRAVPVVLAATLGSIFGGIIAFCIGLWLFNSVGTWLVENFASMEKFNMARELFEKHQLLIIFITAVTPVPYKVVTICAGFMAQDPISLQQHMHQDVLSFAISFLGLSAIFRTGRFAIMGYLLWRFQERANTIVKKYFWQLTIAAIIIAGIGIILMMTL